MDKLISFLVPCYNSQDYMENCIESLLKAGDKAEILIVDDGSKDRTGEIGAEYERKYPGICKLLSQENGGHGEGINHGLRVATGKYFKVVDSDDWFDEAALHKALDALEMLETDGGVDLMICNYVYNITAKNEKHVIKYDNVFPEGEIFGWEDTKTFKPWQYLTLHSVIYRTSVVRASGVVLPKHVFYEDNMFVYYPLPLVEKMYYLNADLYQYFIGREDQSVNEDAMKKRCTHQILVSKEIFKAYDLKEVRKKSKKLANYMYHEIVMVMSLASIFTRLNKTPEAEEMVDEMWAELMAHDAQLAKKVKHRSIAMWVNIPGKAGRKIGCFSYRATHVVIPFN